jgi:hypothetical protein
MLVDIYLTDTETGESKVYHDNFDWQDVANDVASCNYLSIH